MFVEGVTAEAKDAGGVVNITKWIDHLAFDISGALSLGEDFKALEASQGHAMIQSISGKWISVSKFFGIPWLMPLRWASPPSRAVKEANEGFREWTTNAMKKTLQEENSDQKTLLTALLKASDPETGAQLTTSETVATSTGFIIAASDTTAVSLTFTIYYCLANTRVWTRLREEIRSIFRSPDEITGQSTAHLPYLDAVIHEGTRMRPAGPSNLVRETPPEGMEIAGYFIPGKTRVSTSTWTVLHDERHFSNPHTFIPERWLEKERGDIICNKKAYLPFSTGLRSCIGRPLALLEMRLLLAYFVWYFDAELVSQEAPQFEDRFVARRGPLEIRVTPVRNLI